DHRVTFFFTPTVVGDGDRTVSVHHYQVARLRLHCLQVDEAHRTVVLGIEARLLADSRCGTTDVEGTHGELRARLADGLCRDHADGFAQFHQAPGGEVTAIAHHADAALRFAGEHGTDLHPLDAGSLDRAGQLFRDLLVHVDDYVAFVVLDLLERD